MMRPGGIEFTVTPNCPTSSDRPFAQAWSAALAENAAFRWSGSDLAGDVDDAAPAPVDHLRQQRMRDLPLAGEVERHRLDPAFFRRIDRQRAAATGVVHQDVDMPQFGIGDVAQRFRRVLRHDVLADQHRPHAAAQRPPRRPSPPSVRRGARRPRRARPRRRASWRSHGRCPCWLPSPARSFPSVADPPACAFLNDCS